MNQPSALLITYSDVHSDPRVRRQIDWLASDGWVVDTLGLGQHPSNNVRDHFDLVPQAPWVKTRLGSAANYALLPKKLRFRFLMLDRIRPEVLNRISSGAYDLIVFEDYDFLPLLESPTIFTAEALTSHLHLDLHEYRDPRLELTSIRRLLGDRYYRWRRSLIGHPAFTTHTTVASRIADFYVEDFGFDRAKLVRNSPPRIELSPSPVDAQEIRLLFHGMASWARGFRQIIHAMEQIDQRFTMTFMLTGSHSVITELKALAAPLADRITFRQPVPMTEVSAAINEYDLEIMFYQPTHRNLEFSLPNKFFEAIQGRLGVIVGESPMMAEIVRHYGNGVVVEGWGADDLASAIRSLTPKKIAEFKRASNEAANDLNAEKEGTVFLESISAAKERKRQSDAQAS